MELYETIPQSKTSAKDFNIQSQVDMYMAGALIGLEYTMGVYYKSKKEPAYKCLLCDKTLQNIWDHWTSYSHRVKYLETHYPTVVRKYGIEHPIRRPFKRSKLVVQIMAEAIEAFHGRLKVTTMGQDEYLKDRIGHIDHIMNAFHFDEKFGPNFLNVIEEKLPEDVKSPSPIMEISAMPEKYPILNRKFVVNNAEAVLRAKWEKYRNILEPKLIQLQAIQSSYEKSPESHPLYSDEWDIFWVRRFKQLKAENIDPKTYDYKPEWVVFWSERMKELFDAEVEKTKKEIKASLDLPEDAVDFDDKLSHASIDRHIVENIFQPVHDADYPQQSRTLSHSPSNQRHDNVHHYRHTRSRSRSPVRASLSYRGESPLHYHSAPYDDYNPLNNRRNVDNRSPLSYYVSPGDEPLIGTKRFVATHGGRNSVEVNNCISTFNEIPEQRRFVDPHRETMRRRSPHHWKSEKIVDTRKHELEAVHKRNRHNIDDDRAVRKRLEEESCRRTNKIRHEEDGNACAGKDHIRTLAVIDKGLNDGGIPPYRWKKVEPSLTRALVEVLKQNHGPVAQFRDAGWYQGRVKLIAFKDERSPLIYKEALRSLGQIWPSARLDLVSMESVPNRPRAFVQLPAEPSRPNEILELLQKSNPDMPTSNWKVSKVSFERGGCREATITINGKSLAYLEAKNGFIRYGKNTIRLRIFHEDIRDMKKALN